MFESRQGRPASPGYSYPIGGRQRGGAGHADGSALAGWEPTLPCLQPCRQLFGTVALSRQLYRHLWEPAERGMSQVRVGAPQGEPAGKKVDQAIRTRDQSVTSAGGTCGSSQNLPAKCFTCRTASAGPRCGPAHRQAVRTDDPCCWKKRRLDEDTRDMPMMVGAFHLQAPRWRCGGSSFLNFQAAL